MSKNNATKKALMLSLLSMVLCISMLVGSTFAWFTDTATTGVNTIHAGNLDVALEMATEWDADGNPTKWEDAEGKTLQFKVNGATAAEGTKILWEPGCTYALPELRVVNNGNLALKYKVIISGIGGDAELNKAIEWSIALDGVDYVMDKEYELEAKNGNVVDADILTVSGHMKESAGNEYQKLSIDDISVTVIATQLTKEFDSENNTYDKDATYPDPNVVTVKSAEELVEAIAAAKEGATIALARDIVADVVNIDKSVTLDLNGFTISGRVECKSAAAINVTIKDSGTHGNGTYSIKYDQGGSNDAVRADSNGHITIDSGKYISNNGVVTTYDGTAPVTINGGEFVAIEEGMCIGAINGDIEINGGVFSVQDEANLFWCHNGGYVMTINGGDFDAQSSSGVPFYFVGSKTKLIINGGNFKLNTAVDMVHTSYNSTGNLVIQGGTFNVDPTPYVDTENYHVTQDASTWTVTAK